MALQQGALSRRFQFDGCLVCHHGDDGLAFLDGIANLRVPFDDFPSAIPSPISGSLTSRRAMCQPRITRSSASPMRIGPGKYDHSSA